MKKQTKAGLEFVVDKLTNSIENVQSGDSFQTEVSLLTSKELKNITKKNGWNFDWKAEFKLPQREVYKLTIVNNPNIIQGLVSLEVKSDHVFMHLIESAPFNIGTNKVYLGVPGNLVAFSCKLSFQRGGDGYVAFIAKTKLIDHYIKSLGAVHFGGHLMVVTSETALKLIGKYFKS
ncbi:MAG: hypothetical protein KDC31_06620 [Saprospiraceae bacterium]|jgi:hypothetical protein|nr:hypothetical protein [Candidatus Parvibacillus calidus]MBX2938168.1 hypothetical protein [Saprospiraceae bacterium]MBX7179268.1 hypothetical protein [Saprospiraceae bacterium]MCB0590948.1 hypothetical protein [Saprospiraceae bacterium]MCO5281891.1 hypothetical protein [Saprospiraceae bacterium]